MKGDLEVILEKSVVIKKKRAPKKTKKMDEVPAALVEVKSEALVVESKLAAEPVKSKKRGRSSK